MVLRTYAKTLDIEKESHKLHGNRGMFEFLNQVIRKPLVFQLINGLSSEYS